MKIINKFFMESGKYNTSIKRSDFLELTDKEFIEVKEKLELVSTSRSGKKIGYFIYQGKRTVIRIFILPKTLQILDDERENLNAMANYIRRHHEIAYIYPKYAKEYNIKGKVPISDNKDNKDNTNAFDDYLIAKYKSILNDILKYIRHHKKTTRKTSKIKSQSISNKINVAENVKEINKAIVHQTKQEEFSYSEIAKISLNAVIIFENKKFLHESKSEELKNIIFLIKSEIKKRYGYKKRTMKIKEIFNNKTKKIFKNVASKKQYFNIQKLLGADSLINKEINILDSLVNYTYEFIRGDLLYEYHVYEKLKKIYDEVKFDKEDSIGKSYYSKIQGCENQIEIKSNPDYIVTTDNMRIIHDAKWKKFDSIKDFLTHSKNDIWKLERDCRVHKIKEAVLVCPMIDSEKDGIKITIKYKESDVFKFSILVINIYNTYLPVKQN